MNSNPRPEYPRPDFHRPSLAWTSLNGPWFFLFDDTDIGLAQHWPLSPLPESCPSFPPQTQNNTGDNHENKRGEITVPFVFQCPLSEINLPREVHEVLWYERQIPDPRTAMEREKDYRAMLRFGAVDFECRVWLEGMEVARHRGGNVGFDVDLSDALHLVDSQRGARGEYRLTVRVFDSATDLTQPRGKQFWEREARDIWYTASSGIWQSVWVESVPRLRLADGSRGTVVRSDDLERGVCDVRVKVEGRRVRERCSVEVTVGVKNFMVCKSGRVELPADEEFVRFDLSMRPDQSGHQYLSAMLDDLVELADENQWRNDSSIALWTPEHPFLYDFFIVLYDADGQKADEVSMKVGMRSIDWNHGDGTFRLNGKPYLQMLLLDQGYWPETLMTPPSAWHLEQDINLAKSMGFNGCRKHQKVEDPLFMHYANQKGFLVWGEMASTHNFSMDSVDRFNQEWMDMVRRDINHPCIVTWTPVNESWGYPDLGQVRQRDHIRSLYYMTKTMDASRPINDNCGWEHVVTDLSTYHEYGDANRMAERSGSLHAIFHGGRDMWLGPIYGPKGIVDRGSTHTNGAPVMCTEFGGINVATSRDDARTTNWGYTSAADSESLLRSVEDQIMATLKGGHVCGLVWTQFTDIEQEANGLFTYDRKPKVDPQRLKAVMQKANRLYFSANGRSIQEEDGDLKM